MNSHIFEHIASEKNIDLMHSVEFFIAAIVFVGVVGFICLAAI